MTWEKTLTRINCLSLFCLSKKAVTPHWYQIFLRGIGCNWLVSIAVWVRTMPLKLYHLQHSSCFSLNQQAAGARDTVSKVNNWRNHLVSRSHAYLCLLESVDLRDMDTYLGSLRASLIVLSRFAGAHPARRFSSRVDLTTVIPLPPRANLFAVTKHVSQSSRTCSPFLLELCSTPMYATQCYLSSHC